MNYLMRCRWQRGLFCDLSADRRQCGCPSNRKQEARLLSYLSYPYCAIAIKTCEIPVCRDALILVNPVLIHIIRFRPVLARFLLHILVESSFLYNGGLGGSLWSWMGAELDREVRVYRALVIWLVLLVCRLVLVNSGLLHWDFFHGTVVLWRQIYLILVLWLLPSAFRWDLP